MREEESTMKQRTLTTEMAKRRGVKSIIKCYFQTLVTLTEPEHERVFRLCSGKSIFVR